MNKGMLGQTCQIMALVESAATRFKPATESMVSVFDNVQCSLDTLIDAHVGIKQTSAVDAIHGGGLLFIDGDYGVGLTRQFSEKNFIRLDGFDYKIDFVHDVHTGTGLDHYEVEVTRRVAGGTT